MQPLRYELHCHSCVSPCGDDGMTPVMLCGMAKLAELDLLAVTDHNSAANLPAAEEACDAYGLLLLPGIEVTTEEEIHLLCYFPTVEAAQAMGSGDAAEIQLDELGDELDEETRNNPIIYPDEETLKNGVSFIFLSPETSRMVEAMFMKVRNS